MLQRTRRPVLPPPLIYLIFIGGAWAADMLFPLALTDTDTLWTHYLGWGMIDAGLLLMLWAALLMLRNRTTVNPYGVPTRLLEDGPFRLSRNPIYLADTLIYCGVALLWGSLWPWLLLPALIGGMHWGVILREEALLSQLFGSAYVDYCRRVRRWI